MRLPAAAGAGSGLCGPEQSSPPPLLRSLLRFLVSAASAGGAFEDDPGRARTLAAMMGSPATQKSMRREDALTAKITMMGKDIDHLRSDLEASLQRASELARTIEQSQSERKRQGEAMKASEAAQSELNTALSASRASIEALKIQLAEAEQAKSEVEVARGSRAASTF